MSELKLPVVSDDMTALEAMQRIYQAKTAGVLMLSNTHARLIHARDIAASLNGGGKIGHVPNFQPVSVQIVHPDGNSTTIGTPGPTALVTVSSGGSEASLIARYDDIEDYTTPFTLSRCENPIDPHFYPPRDRSKLDDPNTCFCTFPIK